MKVAGIQKMTLVDFPGQVAATIFTQGCSFRCAFCHNPELVLPDKFEALLDEQQIFNFLETRCGKLGGICITGGEPLMQKDIGQFIAHLKAMGFLVKLDTNGSYPERLKEMIEFGDLDYIAMDIKNSLPKYAETANLKSSKSNNDSVFSTSRGTSRDEKSHDSNDKLISNIQSSVSLIMNSGIDYEFRTTVCHPYHETKDFEELGRLIKGAKRYYIQNFVRSKHVDDTIGLSPLSDDELAKALKIMQKYVEKAEIR
jgi:pyruvate formate lyase activating enzyme